jgi:hypothetical protein
MLALRMKLLPGVMRFHGRDIVRVEMPGPPAVVNDIVPYGNSSVSPRPTVKQLPWQPFYRSSGRNSRKPGAWLPFDGIVPFPDPWFDKSRFCPDALEGTPLWRYGTEDYKNRQRDVGRADD